MREDDGAAGRCGVVSVRVWKSCSAGLVCAVALTRTHMLLHKEGHRALPREPLPPPPPSRTPPIGTRCQSITPRRCWGMECMHVTMQPAAAATNQQATHKPPRPRGSVGMPP